MKSINHGIGSLILTVGVILTMSPAFAGEVQNRIDNQEKRIDQGINSGAVTPKEAAVLNANEARIEKQRLADLKANGGKLTSKEYKQLNAKENLQSARIYVAKHNSHKD